MPCPVPAAALVLAVPLTVGTGCAGPQAEAGARRPVAVGLSPLPAGLLNEATAVMRRLETWRGVAFSADVRVRMVATDTAGREGWYDGGRNELVLVAGRPPAFRSLTLVHELCHALQDQHLDLDRWGPAGSGPDAERAWRALVEGEATLAAAELGGLDLHAHHHGLSAGALPDTPANPGVYDTLFTYMEGARYVAALRDAGGWAAVEARWADPPTRPQEILHPDLDAVAVLPERSGGGSAAVGGPGAGAVGAGDAPRHGRQGP